jgi:hypothetical protein
VSPLDLPRSWWTLVGNILGAVTWISELPSSLRQCLHLKEGIFGNIFASTTSTLLEGEKAKKWKFFSESKN